MKTSILSRSLRAVLALATTLSMLAGAEALFAPPAAPTQVVTLPAVTVTHHRDLDPVCWAFLEELLDRLRTHPAVIFPPLPSLFASQYLPSA